MTIVNTPAPAGIVTFYSLMTNSRMWQQRHLRLGPQAETSLLRSAAVPAVPALATTFQTPTWKLSLLEVLTITTTQHSHTDVRVDQHHRGVTIPLMATVGVAIPVALLVVKLMEVLVVVTLIVMILKKCFLPMGDAWHP
jgi:hypothetical protein